MKEIQFNLQSHRWRFPDCVPVGHLLCVHCVCCPKYQRIDRWVVPIRSWILHFDAATAADCLELYPQPEAACAILHRRKCYHVCWNHIDSPLCFGWIALIIDTRTVWWNHGVPAVFRFVMKFSVTRKKVQHFIERNCNRYYVVRNWGRWRCYCAGRKYEDTKIVRINVWGAECGHVVYHLAVCGIRFLGLLEVWTGVRWKHHIEFAQGRNVSISNSIWTVFDEHSPMCAIFSITKLVQAVFTVATFISYGLQCYVPVEIIWTNYLSKRFGGKLKWEFVTRVTIVLITCKWFIAGGIPPKLMVTFLFSPSIISCVGHYRASISFVHFIGRRNVSVNVGHHLPGYHGNLCTLAR